MNGIGGRLMRSVKLGSEERPQSCGSDSGYSGSLGSNPDQFTSSPGPVGILSTYRERPSQVTDNDGSSKTVRKKLSPKLGIIPTVIINGAAPCSSNECSQNQGDSNKIIPGNSSPPTKQQAFEVILPKRFSLGWKSRYDSCTCEHRQDRNKELSSPIKERKYCLDHCDGLRYNTIEKTMSFVHHPILSCGEEGLEDKRKDIAHAVQWLRQEMSRMREQDKELMRTFLELRSSIHGLRKASFGPHSDTDLSFSSVTNPESLYVPKNGERPLLLGLLGDECQVEFRARTVSMVPPRPKRGPSSLQLKTFSKEFV